MLCFGVVSDNARSPELPPKLLELLDEIDQEVRGLPAARALRGRGASPRLAALLVEGLRHLLEGEGKQAASLLEAVVDELRDNTVDLG